MSLQTSNTTLKGLKGLVVGIANEHSIAWGCAEAFRAAGADLAVTYLNAKAEPHVRPLAESVNASIIQALDGTIANVALPHMQGNLSASQDQITWVLTSFILASAITMPLTGWLCDRFGRKNVFLASIAGFTIASVLCGIAGSLTEIVLARFIQGIFGAALVPLSQAVLLDINPREKHGSAMAVWGMGVMIGPILGPTLGGWLTDAYDWRWVFFINVPVGAMALYGAWRYIPKTPATRRMRFDMFGFVTLSLAIGALQMLLDRGEQNDWFSSRETWIEAILLAISLAYFIAHTALRPAGKSFFDYRLLMNSNYVTGLVFISIVGMVLFATRALTPASPPPPSPAPELRREQHQHAQQFQPAQQHRKYADPGLEIFQCFVGC